MGKGRSKGSSGGPPHVVYLGNPQFRKSEFVEALAGLHVGLGKVLEYYGGCLGLWDFNPKPGV